ncbi:MAG: metal ABC transporter ATP-binding protein [Clostridia bacterium]|nr:metal ABC transporter ATP-binding protein [Clostridia bacterium]
MTQLELKDVTVYYDEVCAVKNVDLTVSQGDFLGIIGPNGGGKSTLLKTIIGIVAPSEGAVIKAPDLRIGYVPQFSSFNKSFPISVYDVVLMGRLSKGIRIGKKYKKEDHDAVKRILKTLSLSGLAERHISELSGGQLQKVLIGRAMVSNPNMLILDEPTSNLDGAARSEIYELLKLLNKAMTVVIVSHDMAAISSYVRQVACLNETLYYHGDTEHVGDGIERAYGCPVDIIAHGKPHRVFIEHEGVRL